MFHQTSISFFKIRSHTHTIQVLLDYKFDFIAKEKSVNPFRSLCNHSIFYTNKLDDFTLI